MYQVQVVVDSTTVMMDIIIIQQFDIPSATLYQRHGSWVPVFTLIHDPSSCVSHTGPIYQKGVSHVSPEKTDGGEIGIEILASSMWCHLNNQMTQMTRI